MKLNKNWLIVCLFYLPSTTVIAQNFSFEKIDFQLLKKPEVLIDQDFRNFKVTVTSSYNLTADDVIKKAKEEHQKLLDDYNNKVVGSKKKSFKRN